MIAKHLSAITKSTSIAIAILGRFMQTYRQNAVIYGRWNHPASPYVPVSGSINNGMCGVTKVNSTNANPIKHMIAKAINGDLQYRLSFLNNRVSNRNVTAADMKKIAMLNQSGDLPMAPLYV